MIERFQVLKNIGQFENVVADQHLASFSRLTLVYGENGRGKTTLAAILKAASTGNPEKITERKRLRSQDDPEVVLRIAGENRVFKDGSWNGASPQIAVFDDDFVASNVCSGIEIEAEHRQSLHELVLGAEGVSLNHALLAHITRIEELNRTIRSNEQSIPAAIRGSLTVEEFCAITEESDIVTKIADAERGLTAVRNAQAIAARGKFVAPSLPTIDLGELNDLLSKSLPDVEASSIASVRQHFACLGKNGEEWVSHGMAYVPALVDDHGKLSCPFCEQDLSTSTILDYYRAYFSDHYAALKTEIEGHGSSFSDKRTLEIQSEFEHVIREINDGRSFWSSYVELPDIALDFSLVMQHLKLARNHVRDALRSKFREPLAPMQLNHDAVAAITHYERQKHAMLTALQPLIEKNVEIQTVKERTASVSVEEAQARLEYLRLVKARYSQPTMAYCQAVLEQRAEKSSVEKRRNEARSALDAYRRDIFPNYQRSVNSYLGDFGAGFSIDAVTSVNNRGGSSCTYHVVINQVSVPLTASEGACFRNTLSAGDRSTLALAFFFASLDQNPQLANVVVVIDDPMTSLDEHRSVATVQQIRLLMARVRQVIVLSHFKPYLCEVWNGTAADQRSAFMVRRNGRGSSITEWEVRQDCISEHDKNHQTVAKFVRTGDPDFERPAATALRPMLEAFLRVAYPEDFPPCTCIEPFIRNKCKPLVGTPDEILSQADIDELTALKDYGNRFHHDTNNAYRTQLINEQELTAFCRRVLQFTRR